MHVVIFTGGEVYKGHAVTHVLQQAHRIIAADSGAETALAFGKFPDTVVGDMDSLAQKSKDTLQKKQILFIPSSPNKDETDTELALQFAIELGASKVSIIGGIQGDRIDHIISNIFLITKTVVPVSFVSGNTCAWVSHGPNEVTIAGHTSDLLSLIPLTPQVDGIRTKKLCYPLVNESLHWGQSRGVSNVFEAKTVHITFTKGTLLFVHIMQQNCK